MTRKPVADAHNRDGSAPDGVIFKYTDACVFKIFPNGARISPMIMIAKDGKHATGRTQSSERGKISGSGRRACPTLANDKVAGKEHDIRSGIVDHSHEAAKPLWRHDKIADMNIGNQRDPDRLCAVRQATQMDCGRPLSRNRQGVA